MNFYHEIPLNVYAFFYTEKFILKILSMLFVCIENSSNSHQTSKHDYNMNTKISFFFKEVVEFDQLCIVFFVINITAHCKVLTLF